MRQLKFGLPTRPLAGALACTLTLAVGCGPAEELDAMKGEETSTLAKKKSKVVYGTDDRQDVYAHPNATLRERAQQSTVALMGPDSFNATDPNNVTFSDWTLGEAYNLCSTERFRDDPIAAGCSGTLIDDDLVLTAGHCIEPANNCADTRFVFNYYRPAAGSLKTVTTQDIFSCTSIVARQLGEVGNKFLDYAIVRLDRPATPRFTPAPVSKSNTALSLGQNVAVIGCGSGIPFKIDSGGSVRDARADTLDYFEATTDTFGGNSGSGVYETNGHSVVGILVRGATDYVENGDCTVVNVCGQTGCDGGNGEGITYVYPAIEELCSVTNNGSQRLCGGTQPPPPPPPPGNSYAYSASNTDNAQRNTVNKTLTLAAGDVLEVGTCGLQGASGSGDTFLRLYGPSGTQVAENDDSDSCDNNNSYIKYTASSAGSYTVRAGCFDNGSCSGTVAYTIQ